MSVGKLFPIPISWKSIFLLSIINKYEFDIKILHRLQKKKCFMYHDKFGFFMLKLLELKKTHSTFRKINEAN